MTTRLGVSLGSALLVAACSDGPSTPAPTPSSLSVLCDVTGFNTVGQQGRCSARITLTDSTTVEQPTGVQWSSSDSTKVNVSSGGIVTAVAPGSAEIRALYSGLSGSRDLAVTVACVFSQSPSTVAFSSDGGTQNVALTAAPEGCSPATWTASSGNPALSVLPASGSGNATISLTAQANRGPAETWTASIAGHTVTATIAPAPPPPPRVLTLTLEQGQRLSGPYSGTATGPNGFVCALGALEESKACAPAQFSHGQFVTLTVAIDFAGDGPIWRTVGCDSVTRNTCTVTMTSDRSVLIGVGCTSC